MISIWELVARLLLALAFAGAVGLQRELTGKVAGMRTHMLVGVGAAVFTLASGFAFAPSSPDANRAASQLITGIGFIGGGAILKEGGSVKGLTTAAGLWAVAALGMAAGVGLYWLALLATVLMLLTLVVFRRLERRLQRQMREHWTLSFTLPTEQPVAPLQHTLTAESRALSLIGLASDEAATYTYRIEFDRPRDLGPLTAGLKGAGATGVGWRAAGNIEEH